MPVVSTIFVTMLQILLKMRLSHFIDEQAGSKFAKAFTGLSFSMLLADALSIRVTAPSGAFTLR